MTKKERVKTILTRLDEHYPADAKCYLFYGKPYELLIATILSAQCTDDRVNMVTEKLFVKYPELEAFAAAKQEELEEDIRSTGFFRMKAKHIIQTANMLLTEHNGIVPDNINALIKLPGVGRKTANLMLGHIYDIPSIVVDTHVGRISNKLGLADTPNPEKIEYALMKILPKGHWIRFNTQVIAHGRAVCTARSPKCGSCILADCCPSCKTQLPSV